MKHTVQFDPVLHAYTVNGQRWASVTQIIDPMLELDGIPKHVLAAAAEFGTHVHQACHLFNVGTLDEQDLDEPLRPYLNAWKKFLVETRAVVVDSERIVSHYALQVAGMLDSVVRFPGRVNRHVLDIKTSVSVPWTVGMQTAAYREMLFHEERNIPLSERVQPALSKERLCCHLLPDGSYRLKTLRQSSDWNDFVSCVNVHNLRKKHGR